MREHGQEMPQCVKVCVHMFIQRVIVITVKHPSTNPYTWPQTCVLCLHKHIHLTIYTFVYYSLFIF